MVRTEADEVPDFGFALVVPLTDVVGDDPACGGVTAGDTTALVAFVEGGADVGRREPVISAHIEREAEVVEHDGGDDGVAAQF